jgi:hypothetical protein
MERTAAIERVRRRREDRGTAARRELQQTPGGYREGNGQQATGNRGQGEG